MVSRKSPQHSFEVLADGLTGQVRALVDVNDQTSELVSSAGRLAERTPLLGSSPPALHLAMRLREAAGSTGLTGEVGAADTELASYHRALDASVRRYQDGDRDTALRFPDEGPAT